MLKGMIYIVVFVFGEYFKEFFEEDNELFSYCIEFVDVVISVDIVVISFYWVVDE